MGPDPDFSCAGGSAEPGAAPDPASAWCFPTHLQQPCPTALPGPGEALPAAVLGSVAARGAQPGQLRSVPGALAWRSFMGLLPSCHPSRHRGAPAAAASPDPAGGMCPSPARPRGLGLAAPSSERSRLAKRSVVWMWEKSQKCFFLLPLPAWLLSTTPS